MEGNVKIRTLKTGFLKLRRIACIIIWYRAMIKLIKFLVPVFIISFLIWNISQDWSRITPYISEFSSLPLIISFLFFLTIYPEGAVTWFILLRKMGLKILLGGSIKVWIISTTSRYIPGSIWQYVSRVEMSSRVLGLSRSAVTTSLLLEVFIGLTAAALVSLLMLPLVSHLKLSVPVWVFLLPIFLIFTDERISHKLIVILAKLLKKDFSKSLIYLKIKDKAIVLVFSAFNFFLNGFALFFLIKSVYPGNIDLLQLTGIYSFSWAVGYISVFAPAGIGITEASLAYFLGFMLPPGLNSLIALSYRLLLTLSELFVFLFSLHFLRNEE